MSDFEHLDGAILRLVEERGRPGKYCWPVRCIRQATIINQSLGWLEERHSLLDSRLTIGSMLWAACLATAIFGTLARIGVKLVMDWRVGTLYSPKGYLCTTQYQWSDKDPMLSPSPI
ncbi:MAG: hypothetical protein P8L34_01495 [Arenicellales bacterium]|nr:hypothetical protein [Arenicellales bacterium]